jgi:hypothetical protein
MSRQPATYYRYRAFNTTTLDSLCHDTLYFAHPGTFNDPLDCRPSVNCDSERVELRELVAWLVEKRVSAEIRASLRTARVKEGEKMIDYATKRAKAEVVRNLEDIAYHSTNPEHEGGQESVENWLLTLEIEKELLRYYERGVCCFSTSYASPLLWSHYGDQHQGVCIGYGLDRTPTPQLEKVVYSGERIVKTSTLTRAFIRNDRAACEELDANVLLRKAPGWSYEREWRLIGSQGVQDSPLLLKEITFGLRCSSSVKHAIVQALNGRKNAVKFFEIDTISERRALRKSLDTGELAAYLPRTATSIEEHGMPDCESDETSELSK